MISSYVRKNVLAFLILIISVALNAQETIGSAKAIQLEYSALVGKIDRPYLNYKTLSDNEWDNIDLIDLYGPELFMSYNSTSPYGYNDGPLWQGRGLNSSLSSGIRVSTNGFEITIKPIVTYSQNISFEMLPSAYAQSDYGYIWSYFPLAGVDAPQRFGQDPFFDFSWGDSEIRYSWKALTLGLGTQLAWVGPGKINAIIHSNNATPYPKIDIGLRRFPLNISSLYLGDFEIRLWAGYLSESDYFDYESSNDHNLLSALSIAYAPSFLPGLSLFANRSYMSPWEIDSINAITSLFFVKFVNGAYDVWDQRGSFGFDYLLPDSGIEVYAEIGINDYAPGIDGYIRYPFHSMVYNLGLRKSVDLSNMHGLMGELCFEWTSLELSQDFQFQWPATFYMHHQIYQGYTNRGQWLGAAIGTGGNSQYLGFRLFYNQFLSEIFIQRVNPDNDFIYKNSIVNGTLFDPEDISNFRSDLSIGIRSNFVIDSFLHFGLGFVMTQINNPLYNSISYRKTNKDYNFRIEALFKYEI